jgi:hypothetical protein
MSQSDIYAQKRQHRGHNAEMPRAARASDSVVSTELFEGIV